MKDQDPHATGASYGPALLRVGQVAARLGVSSSTVRGWEERYLIAPRSRSEGGHRRYDERNVEQLQALRDLLRPRDAAARAESPTAVETGDAELLLATTRALLRAADVASIRDALIAYVHIVGGTTVSPVDGGRDALPLDLSFGEGDPVVASAESPSVVRLQLESALPGLVEDARHMVALLRSTSTR